MALDKAKKAELVKTYGKNANDTGSVEVQVAILTTEINELTAHFAQHKHDFHSKLGMLKKVGQRRSLLDYLKREDVKRYKELIKKLNIRK